MSHELALHLPKSAVGVSDLEVIVRNEDEIIGTLAISKGAIEWRPRKKQRAMKMSWEKFDIMMQENGRRKRK